MGLASLPGDGELRLGPVTLPAGKQVRAGFGRAVPVAWVTSQPVQEPGRVWAALSSAQPDTGLVPFLAGTLPGDPARPWDSEEFGDPAEPAQLDDMDAAEILAGLWDGEMPSDDEKVGDFSTMTALRRALSLPDEDDDASFAAMIAPFSRKFPGLAAAGDTQLSAAQLADTLATLPPARIGLAPATRPADVLPLIGWTPSDQSDALPVAAVVRFWEGRFGARLLQVGFAEISLLIERPPRSIEHAQRIAAEHFAFCDECAGQGLHEIASIAARLMELILTFWGVLVPR